MKGNVNLVLKNTGFNNNGKFNADIGTVKFTGNSDTTVSYVKGDSSSLFYNLHSNKTNFGLVLKKTSFVKNVLNVSGGQLYTDSNLTLLSDANLTARVDVVPSGSNIYGKAMVQRHMPGRRAWRLMTAPVTNSNTIFNTWQNGGVYESGKGTWVTGPNPTGVNGNGLDVSIQNNISMRKFNYSTQAFTNVANTHVPISSGTNGVADNVGYFIFVRGDRIWENFNYAGGACNITTLTSIGNLQTGTQTFVTAKDSAKYTLIGNPFASPIDFNNITRNNLVKRMYILDPTFGTTGTWVMLDDIDNNNSFTKSIDASNMTQHIQSSQAFFVVTSGNVPSASITISETSKSNGNNNQIMGRPSAENQIASLRSTLYMVDADTAYIADGALTEFDNRYSAATNLEDASKISNTNENLTLIRNGLGFCVERRPMLSLNDTIYFRLWRTSQRNYRFEFQPSFLAESGLQGYLEDSYLNTSTPISLAQNTIVNFSINSTPASANEYRFKIIFRPAAVFGPLPVTITNVQGYMVNEEVVIKWDVEYEIDIVKYEIEKSIDGVLFEKIGTKEFVPVNTTFNKYNFIDFSPLSGNNFYRIKIINKDGSYKYSSVVKVYFGKMQSNVSIYPNPITDGIINLQINDPIKGTYSINLINALGQNVYTNKIVHNNIGVHKLAYDRKLISSGMYVLEVVKPDKSKFVQTVIVK